MLISRAPGFSAWKKASSHMLRVWSFRAQASTTTSAWALALRKSSKGTTWSTSGSGLRLRRTTVRWAPNAFTRLAISWPIAP